LRSVIESKLTPLACTTGGVSRLVYSDPNAAAPVAAPRAGIAPAILFTVLPLPVVFVHAQPQLRLVFKAFLDAPAVAFVIADNSG